MLLFLPDEEVGVFLTHNTQGIVRDLFYPQFMATFFPDYMAPAELGEFTPLTAEELAPLAGLYSDLRLAGILSVVEVIGDGQLSIKDAVLGPRTITQVDDNLFIDELTNSYTAFSIDEQNGIVYMKEPYLNPLGYARKGDTPVGFTDVEEDNPFAPYILAMQSIGHYANEEGATFAPQQPISKAEFVDYLLKTSGLKSPSADAYAFSDIEFHPIGNVIQYAYELGMISGNEEGKFEPSSSITRQEAAVMMWRMYNQLYPDKLFEEIQLSGETDDWAVPAVKMMVAFGYYGPEVSIDENGSVDFHSQQFMTRQEAAAFYYQALLQPADQIANSLMQQQQTNDSEEATLSPEGEE